MLIYDLCTPRDDVREGTIAEADYAADLARVIRQQAPFPYQHATDFFENTYPTRGLKELLANVCRRLSGVGGAAASIFRLDTQYGGGKTHGLIALIHAARGMQGVANVAEFLDPALLPRDVQVAAFDGEIADPANGRDLGQGIRAHTPWGEIAFALAGPAGYERVRQSDVERVAPGSETIEALLGDRPALILLDELPVYLRKIMHSPAARDQLAPFLTALFKAVETRPRTALVYTLAVGKDGRAIDAYSEEHQFIAQRIAELESISARKATLLNPTEDDETVQVLRRRLFKRIDFDRAEAVIDAYQQAWQAQREHLPSFATRPETVDAFRQSYPLHPDVLETLTGKTATLANFQRVRGMLRLLARTVANVWKERPVDAHALHLHHIDPGNELIRQEFVTRLGQGAFSPAVRGDVSSHDANRPSLAEQIDAEHYRGLLPYGSHVARTIFLHTLAFNDQLKGITPEHLRFSIVSPGTDISFVDDARKRFTAESAYIDDRPAVKLRFLAEANLNQIIRRQELEVDPGTARATMNDRIREVFNGRDFNFIPFPAGGYDVPDEIGDGRPLLALISYDAVAIGSTVDAVPELVRRIFVRKGADESGLRGYRNNIVFVVADDSRKDEMRRKVVRRLALAELRRADRLQELAEHQRAQVLEQELRAQGEVAGAIQECYRHIFYPSRNRIDGQDVDLAHAAIELPGTAADPGAGQKQIVRALRESRKLRLIEDEPDAPSYIRDHSPLQKAGHISTRELRDEFRRNPRLPILAHDDLLIRAIRRGVELGEFVYRHNDLLFGPGDPPATVHIDEQAFVFTMSYAREHGVWPRREVQPAKEGSGTTATDDTAPPPPRSAPVAPAEAGTLGAQGVLRDALTQLWEQARARNVEHIALLRVRLFEGGDAFRFIVAASGLAGAQKYVTLEAEYETPDGGSFDCRYVGPLTEVLPVKEFLEPQMRAARDRMTSAAVELRFEGGLSLRGDAPETLAERLTRQPTGAAYVEAVAEIAVNA